MGLFTNKKKECPLCGKATPALFATKIQGQAICSECAGKILADSEVVGGWSLDDLIEHLKYREENKRKVERFSATRVVDVDRELHVDDRSQTFYIAQWTVENPPIFGFDESMGYVLERDWHAVESWSRGTPRAPYQPPELGAIGAFAAFAETFVGSSQKDDDQDSANLKLTLKLNNRYLKEYEVLDLSANGDSTSEFRAHLSEEMSKLNAACNLIISMAEGTVSQAGFGAPQSAGMGMAQPAGGVEEIKKYKELLDAGIITQEEFNGKKKQLLGI